MNQPFSLLSLEDKVSLLGFLCDSVLGGISFREEFLKTSSEISRLEEEIKEIQEEFEQAVAEVYKKKHAKKRGLSQHYAGRKNFIQKNRELHFDQVAELLAIAPETGVETSALLVQKRPLVGRTLLMKQPTTTGGVSSFEYITGRVGRKIMFQSGKKVYSKKGKKKKLTKIAKIAKAAKVVKAVQPDADADVISQEAPKSGRKRKKTTKTPTKKKKRKKTSTPTTAPTAKRRKGKRARVKLYVDPEEEGELNGTHEVAPPPVDLTYKCAFDNGHKVTMKEDEIRQYLVPIDGVATIPGLLRNPSIEELGMINNIYRSNGKGELKYEDVIGTHLVAEIPKQEDFGSEYQSENYAENENRAEFLKDYSRVKVSLRYSDNEKLNELQTALLAFYDNGEDRFDQDEIEAHKEATVKELKDTLSGSSIKEEDIEAYSFESYLLFKLFHTETIFLEVEVAAVTEPQTEEQTEEQSQEQNQEPKTVEKVVFKEGLQHVLRHGSIIFSSSHGFCCLVNPENQTSSSMKQVCARPLTAPENLVILPLEEVLYKRVNFKEYKELTEYEINHALCKDLYIVNHYCAPDSNDISAIEKNITELQRNLRGDHGIERKGMGEQCFLRLAVLFVSVLC